MVPQVGAAVWIEFEQGDPEYPIWTGGFWGSAAEPPALAKAGNPVSPSIILQTTLQNEKALGQLAIQNIIKRYDYHETGGALLLGIDGICIICHGSSGERAIQNARGMAARHARARLNELIVKELAAGPVDAGED